MNGLVIFVDSLRYDAAPALELEEHGLTPRKYVPPLGYSANILPLLYRGKTPDELGFYNEFGVGETDRAPVLSRFDRLVESVGWVPILRKVIYRGLREAGLDAANIPLRHFPYFAKHATSAYAPSTSHPSVLQSTGFHPVIADQIRTKAPARDQVALRQARTAIEEEPRVFVSLCDLDTVSHEWGLESPEYLRHRDMLRVEIHALLRRWRELWGDSSPVVVLSDHGMAPVIRAVRPNVEERLGPSGRSRYLYFVDSTMVRFWCYDEDLRPRIHELLDDWSGIGRTVTPEERRDWGLVNTAHGELIFVLDEGLVFDPNFIGRGVPKAMHGYHPGVESQHAVFLTNQPELLAPAVMRGSQPYEALCALFAR